MRLAIAQLALLCDTIHDPIINILDVKIYQWNGIKYFVQQMSKAFCVRNQISVLFEESRDIFRETYSALKHTLI